MCIARGTISVFLPGLPGWRISLPAQARLGARFDSVQESGAVAPAGYLPPAVSGRKRHPRSLLLYFITN